ncbi:unnamed protein product [Lampetra fluviatilis]
MLLMPAVATGHHEPRRSLFPLRGDTSIEAIHASASSSSAVVLPLLDEGLAQAAAVSIRCFLSKVICRVGRVSSKNIIKSLDQPPRACSDESGVPDTGDAPTPRRARPLRHPGAGAAHSPSQPSTCFPLGGVGQQPATSLKSHADKKSKCKRSLDVVLIIFSGGPKPIVKSPHSCVGDKAAHMDTRC